jgi:hypothetical protein
MVADDANAGKFSRQLAGEFALQCMNKAGKGRG